MLGYMEIWWYEVACVYGVSGAWVYGGMVAWCLRWVVVWRLSCRMKIARCIISWREEGTVARVTWRRGDSEAR